MTSATRKQANGICRYCGEPIEYQFGTGWVETRSGDDGGNYDFCPDAPGEDWEFDAKQHDAADPIAWSWLRDEDGWCIGATAKYRDGIELNLFIDGEGNGTEWSVAQGGPIVADGDVATCSGAKKQAEIAAVRLAYGI